MGNHEVGDIAVIVGQVALCDPIGREQNLVGIADGYRPRPDDN
jgi:hypothetical protein